MKPVSYIVYQTLRRIGLRRDQILSGKEFKDELGLDSIEIIYLANLLENRLQISIPDQDISCFTNPESTVSYINKYLIE